ncbi:hypothetical protein VCV18_010158 [Metarhizium anisopliae]
MYHTIARIFLPQGSVQLFLPSLNGALFVTRQDLQILLCPKQSPLPLVWFPEISESRGNLHAVFPLGACFVTILGAGSEMIVTDERDSQVEAKGMDVRDVEAGHHGVEDDSGVLNGVLVDVVADTGLHCDAVRLWVDEFFGEDFEDGCRVGTGLGYLEHAKHAEPVVVVRDDAVVTDHEVPVFDAHCCEL